MRWLWLSHETPDIRGQGGQRCQYYRIKALVDAGEEVTVVNLRTEQDARSITALTTTQCIVGTSRIRRFLGLRNPHVSTAGYDVAVVSHLESTRMLGRHLRMRLPWLVDFHNVGSRWAAASGDRRKASWFRTWEKRVLRRATGAMAVSESEAAALRQLAPDRPVFVCPLGIDASEWPIKPRVAGRAVIAVFGSWWYPPNSEGLEWFATEVWPSVLAAVPPAELLVLGPGGPPASLHPVRGLVWRGHVDDLASALTDATVVAVPVLRGPGVPMKFAEAMASGAAVVATVHAAEAMQRPDGCAVTDDPGAFADSCISLLTDPQRRARASRACREAALAQTWDHTVRPIIEWAHASVPRNQ